MIFVFMFEILSRLRKNAARVQDPEIDKLSNLHHIKHWMDPGEFAYSTNLLMGKNEKRG